LPRNGAAVKFSATSDENVSIMRGVATMTPARARTHVRETRMHTVEITYCVS